MKSKKRIIVIVAIVLVLIVAVALAVRYLPWPTYVQRTYTVYSISDTGEKQAEYQLKVKAWKLDYLRDIDYIHTDYTMYSGDAVYTKGEPKLPYWSYEDLGADIYKVSTMWYDGEINGFADLLLYTDLDFDVFIARYNDQLFIGSTEDEFDLESVKDSLDFDKNSFMNRILENK